MLVGGAYFCFVGLVMMTVPNTFFGFIGVKLAEDIWVRILGMVILIISFYYFLAIREKAVNFYRWTVYGRIPIIFVFSMFVVLGYAEPLLLLIGTIDTLTGVWTAIALKMDGVGLKLP